MNFLSFRPRQCLRHVFRAVCPSGSLPCLRGGFHPCRDATFLGRFRVRPDVSLLAPGCVPLLHSVPERELWQSYKRDFLNPNNLKNACINDFASSAREIMEFGRKYQD